MTQGNTTITQAVPLAQIKLVTSPPPVTQASSEDDTGYDEDPTYPEKTSDGKFELIPNLSYKYTVPAGRTPAISKLPVTGSAFQRQEVTLDLTPRESIIIGFVIDPAMREPTQPDEYLNDELRVHVTHSFPLQTNLIVALRVPTNIAEKIKTIISTLAGVEYSEPDPCRGAKEFPSDPYFLSKSSWKQNYDDQWAIKRVGFTLDPGSPWSMKVKGNPVTVAVIDTGLDWNHKDISWSNLWKNEKEIPENGIDDDKNGYVDDYIGWDFFQRTGAPWDQSGHGTFVTGIIAATQNNGAGIAGINPHARVMVLKALNSFGHSRASYLAEAITYAANKGAKVMNLSAGGPILTRTEQMAVDYAYSKGAVVVVASGNEASDISNVSPAGLRNVLTVAASDISDKRTVYSNWGAGVDLIAPGNDVLSLRARRTDLMRDVTGARYTAGQAYVGEDKRYYRASGTSFSTPIVAGAASLLFALRPELTNQQVERMLLQSAKDIDVPGKDQHSGYGLLDARAALSADPSFFIVPEITGVNVVAAGNQQKVQVMGTADADRFKKAHLEIGAGSNPAQWKSVSQDLISPVRNGVLGEIPASQFAGSVEWTIRVVVEHQNGRMRETWFNLKLQ